MATRSDRSNCPPRRCHDASRRGNTHAQQELQPASSRFFSVRKLANDASTRQGSRLSKLSRGNSLIHQRSPDALLDAVKVDHFLDCLSSPSFLQDVAYGTRIHKLESGQSLEVPNMVRTVISSHLFLESNFEPL